MTENDLKAVQNIIQTVKVTNENLNNQLKTIVESWDSFYNPKPDLLVQNFKIKLNNFIKNRKLLLSELYNDNNAVNDFILNEIKDCLFKIDYHTKKQFTKEDEKKIKRLIEKKIILKIKNKQEYDNNKENIIVILNAYLFFLNTKLKSISVEPKQNKNFIPDEALLKNEYVKIFKNDIGFTLFTKMFEFYKTENTHLANFSFLFYAMEKDFLVCSQTDFIKFLENDIYDVSIEKIDSRQIGKNKKSKLYNSIKETLQKKHEKSTI